MAAFSFSAIKKFKQCPKQYYHLKVAADVKDRPGEAAIYGQDAHTAAEEYVKNGTPIPKKYEIMQPAVEALMKLKGEKHAEIKLGVQKTEGGYFDCDFDDDSAWYRGIADLVIIDGKLGYCVDYKTGKNARYADTKQLDLMAGALFLRFPKLEKIKSALAFVKSEEWIEKVHFRDRLSEYLGVFQKELADLATAHDTNTWNAIPTPLCGWCSVKKCEHWKPKRRY